MLVQYGAKFGPEEARKLEEQIELVTAIREDARVLYENHIATSKKWYPHLIVPWGAGEDYNTKEWKEEQATLSPDIRLTLETNLLTEDNLPYYHHALARFLEGDEIWSRWNRRWTAEEDKHAGAIRSYLYLTRNADPVEMDDNRQEMIETGFDRPFDPVSIFAYTTIQELATRVSHSNTGRVAQEPILRGLLNCISTDENFHFVFYRDALKAMLARAPEIVLPGIVKEFYTFSMPGEKMKDFKRRMEVIADLGIYGPREHRDNVIKPVLKYWGIESLTGLSPESQKMQEKLLKLVSILDRVVEQRERKKKKTD